MVIQVLATVMKRPPTYPSRLALAIVCWSGSCTTVAAVTATPLVALLVLVAVALVVVVAAAAVALVVVVVVVVFVVTSVVAVPSDEA